MRPRLILLALVAAGLAAWAPAGASAAACSADTPSLVPGTASIDIPYSCAIAEPPAIVGTPSWGTATVVSSSATGAVLRYAPEPGLRGVDRFTWSGAEGGSVTQYVVVGSTLKLNCRGVTQLYDSPPPIVARDGQDQGIRILCDRIAGDSLAIQVTSAPTHGTATVVPDSSGQLLLRYRSEPGYVGPDAVSVRVTSPVPGRSSDSFAIPIAVKAANRAPVCTPPPTVVVPVRLAHADPGFVQIPNLCSDPDGDPLAYGIVRAPAGGSSYFGADGVLNYEPYIGFSGRVVIPVIVGDGFTESTVDVTVEVRAAAPPPEPPPPTPPSVVAPPAALPSPPAGFVPARGADLGADAVVWGPLGGIRLGRRALPVIAAGCRQACTLRAQLRLYANRRGPVALPAQTLQLAAGGRQALRMRLTAAARNAVRGRRRVNAVLSLELTPAQGPVLRDTVELKVRLGRSPGR